MMVLYRMDDDSTYNSSSNYSVKLTPAVRFGSSVRKGGPYFQGVWIYGIRLTYALCVCRRDALLASLNPKP